MFAPPGADAVATMFGAFAKKTDDPEDIANAGCLMVNTVFELGRTRAAVRDEVDAYREMWRSTFEGALAADGIEDAAPRAEFLVGALWGALSQIRLTGTTESAAPLAAVVVDTVRGWKREAASTGVNRDARGPCSFVFGPATFPGSRASRTDR